MLIVLNNFLLDLHLENFPIEQLKHLINIELLVNIIEKHYYLKNKHLFIKFKDKYTKKTCRSYFN